MGIKLAAAATFAMVFVSLTAACGGDDAAPTKNDLAGSSSGGGEDDAKNDEVVGQDDPEPAAGASSTDFDQDPDANADPSAVAPADDPTMPPATQAELIKRYSPHLHLHPDDQYRPANVDWFLSRVTLRFHHNNCPDHEILGKGKVTQAALAAQAHDDNKSFCLHDGNKEVKSTASDHFFMEIADHASYKGSARAEWKTYVAWRPRSGAGGWIDIEYWFFYPYNDGFSLFNHESDWEHVRVTIDPKADGGQGSAKEVKFSAHKGGTILKAGDASLTMEGGTHPVSYVAKGTHANYPKPGTFEIPDTKGVAKDNAKSVPAADIWKTESALVVVGTRAAPKNGQIFIKYWGRWGELGDLPETNGVTRHFP